ncbi:MAG: (Fe-S)-binding protein [Leptospirales bacterium]|nr:(Fe-S)-binding protein [Leptospirales bacterium]
MKLEDYAETIKKCSQCNFCQAVCPIYKAQESENWLARHRLNLINDVLIEKSAEASDRFKDIMDKCLLCTSCTQYCSSGVPADEIIISAREKIIEGEKGISSIKRGVMTKVFKDKGLRDIAAKAGSFAQKLGLGSDMPKFVSKTFASRVDNLIKAEGTKQGVVAYYYGCGTNLMYPEAGEALVKILSSKGYDVIVPKDITCCGIPIIAEGDIAEAAEVMRKNIEELSKLECDKVVMECSSCLMMFMKKSAKLFAADDPIQEKITALNGKIVGGISFLNTIFTEKISEKAMPSFTYHIPCHKEKFSEDKLDVVDLVSKITKAEYRAMDNPELCCGAGGAYYMKNSDISKKIRSPKIDEMNNSKADVVVTECPICRFYLKNGAQNIDVLHPIEFIYQSIK